MRGSGEDRVVIVQSFHSQWRVESRCGKVDEWWSMIDTWMKGCLGSHRTGTTSSITAFGMIRNDPFGIPGLGIEVNEVLCRTASFWYFVTQSIVIFGTKRSCDSRFVCRPWGDVAGWYARCRDRRNGSCTRCKHRECCSFCSHGKRSRNELRVRKVIVRLVKGQRKTPPQIYFSNVLLFSSFRVETKQKTLRTD